MIQQKGADLERARRMAQILDQPFSSLDLAAYRAGIEPGGSKPAVVPLASQWKMTVEPNDFIQAAPIADSASSATPAASDGARQATLQAVMTTAIAPSRVSEIADRLSLSPGAVLEAIEPELGRRIVVHEIQRLRQTVDEIEISRWPGSPFAVSRTYWVNNVAVRMELEGLPDALVGPMTFLRFLRELHVTYLMGADLATFYYPDSETRLSLGNWATGPGQVRNRSVRCPIGHAFEFRYFRLLAHGLRDQFAGNENVAIRDEDGGLLGDTHWSWAESKDERAGAHVFTTVGTLRPAHVERLWLAARTAWAAVEAGEAEAVIQPLGRFLRLFICLHPFMCGNMGLVMNIVNRLLRLARGQNVCHLHLDWCAHRLEPGNFDEVFRRAVERYAVYVDDDGSRRDMLARFAAAKASLGALTDGSNDRINEWLQNNSEARRALLL